MTTPANIPPRVRNVIAWVAHDHKVSVDDIIGPRRFKKLVIPRRAAMRAVRCMIMANCQPPSYPQIGRWFNRDHTTVLHHCRNLDYLVKAKCARVAIWRSVQDAGAVRALVAAGATPEMVLEAAAKTVGLAPRNADHLLGQTAASAGYDG